MVTKRLRFVRETDSTDDHPAAIDRLAQFTSDATQLEARRREFAQGGERWVGMHRGKAYEAGDLASLLEALRTAGVDPSLVPVRFVSDRRAPHEHLV